MQLEDIWVRCPHCGKTFEITRDFYKKVDSIIEDLKEEKEKQIKETKWPRTDWDESLVKLKFNSPDWDD